MIGPGALPAVRLTTMAAGGKSQVGAPSKVNVNFTGTEPRLAVKTLDPSAFKGGWILAEYLDSKIANGENDVEVPQIVVLAVFTVAPALHSPAHKSEAPARARTHTTEHLTCGPRMAG